MIKPWLLMNPEERKERIQLYLDCISGEGPIDEFLIVSLKPPETKLEALFELFTYQVRKRKSIEGK